MRKYYGEKTDKITKLEIKNEKKLSEIGGECMVLLKNENVLPLQTGKVALYGYGARHTMKGGTGSGDVNARRVISVEKGLENAGFKITTKDWLDRYDNIIEMAEKTYIDDIHKMANEKNIPNQMAMFEYPYQLPDAPDITEKDGENADTAIYVLSRISGEGRDRRYEKGDYLLSEAEERALEFLAKHYKNTILLLNTGGVLELKKIAENKKIQAIMIIGQNGSIGGKIVADTLTGRQVPSGKLCDTWAGEYKDYPYAFEYGSNNNNIDDEYYKEDIFVGYRYFMTQHIKPLYCFGYGLGYTNFKIKIDSFEIDNHQMTCGVSVENTGDIWTGKEVVQIYMSKPQGHLKQPYQELVGFKKTSQLLPGEKEKVSISFNMEDFAGYDEEKAAYVLEKGAYVVRIGNSCENTEVCGSIHLDEDIIVKKISHLKKERKNYKTDRTEVITLDDVSDKKATIEELVAQLSVEEMAKLCVGVYELEAGDVVGAASNLVPGAAGETCSDLLEERKIYPIIMADGPAGLRLQPHFKIDNEGKLLSGGNKRGMEIVPFPENLPDDAVDYYQYCTAIPIAATLAQSWNEQLFKEMGRIVQSEMEKFHIDLWLAPGMNIHRNPLCGRNYEYYSEDPYLSGIFAAAETKGVQENKKFGVTIKHFVANNQEDNRMFNNVHISERALREIYLKGFEIAVKNAQPCAIMTSYNLVNGVHAANHYEILQQICRDEWKFDGMIMTDWCTSQDTTYLGFTSDKYSWSSSTGCIKAGNDLQMPGCEENVIDIINGVKNGIISLGDLQFCTINILKTILKLKY